MLTQDQRNFLSEGVAAKVLKKQSSFDKYLVSNYQNGL
jgi:hypothetical protein